MTDDLMDAIEQGFAALRNASNETTAIEEIEVEHEVTETDAQEEIETKSTQPPPKGRRATQEFQRAEAAIERANAADRKIAELEAKINGVIGVNDILNPKHESTVDDLLTKNGLNPDDYFNDADKKTALNQIELSKEIKQIKYEKYVNETVSQIEDGLNFLNEKEPVYGAAATQGINMLIQNETFIILDSNPNLSEAQAQMAARNNIMSVVASKAQKTGQDPFTIAVKLGGNYAKRMGVDLMAIKPLTKENNNINIKAANALQGSAGSSNVNSAALNSSQGSASLSNNYQKFLSDIYG